MNEPNPAVSDAHPRKRLVPVELPIPDDPVLGCWDWITDGEEEHSEVLRRPRYQEVAYGGGYEDTEYGPGSAPYWYDPYSDSGDELDPPDWWIPMPIDSSANC